MYDEYLHILLAALNYQVCQLHPLKPLVRFCNKQHQVPLLSITIYFHDDILACQSLIVCPTVKDGPK